MKQRVTALILSALLLLSVLPAPVQAVAKNTRSIPKEFLAPDRPDVTLDFLQFARPLVGTLPFCQIL